jgi:hypothetical protein
MSESYKSYLENYDRKAAGAGSQKDPAKDRLSALDVSTMFKNRGDLSAKEGAQNILDYFETVKDDTSHGGGTQKALDKMRKFAGREGEAPVEEAPEPLSQRATKAIAYTDAYQDFRQSGRSVDLIMGDLSAQDELVAATKANEATYSGDTAADDFMDNYAFQVKKELKPGTPNRTAPKPPGPSKLAQGLVGKGAGFKEMWNAE